jgi:MFS family permease
VLPPRLLHGRRPPATTPGQAADAASADTRAYPWRVLRKNKDFRWYFCGSVTSDLGTWLQNTAQVLLAYRLAHSVFAVGLVTFAQFSSPLVLGPWAGVMADRFGGRRTLLGTQVLSGLVAMVLALLDLTGTLTEWWLVGGAIVSGLSFTFALPARNVTVQRLVPREDTRPAYVMDAVSYNIGRAAAPLLTIAVGPRGNNFAWAFIANAVSFAAFTVVLWWADQHGTIEPRVRSRVTAGFSIALHDRRIAVLLLMVAAVTVADDPILVLGPALASHLHAPPDWSGWFIAALGAGSVCGSLRRSDPEPRLRLAAGSLAMLSICMIAFVLAPSMLLSTLAAFGAGVSCLIANSATRTLLSKRAGPDRVAAVMAVWAIAWAGSKPFASLVDGMLGTHIGIAWTGLILAAPAFIPILALLVALGIRARRGQVPAAVRPDTAHSPSASAPNAEPEAEPAFSLRLTSAYRN